MYYILPNPRGPSTIIANGPGVLVLYSGWTGGPSTEGSTYYGTRPQRIMLGKPGYNAAGNARINGV